MRRPATLEVAVLGILAAAIVLLVLNLLEADEYPTAFGATRGADELPSWFLAAVEHPCPTCGPCAHRFETAESRIVVTITDHDGWYRLFWAGADTYVYDDPAMVGGALRNRTAELASGTWTIRGRFVPAAPHPGHECTPAPRDVELRYRLRRGIMAEPEEPVIDPSGVFPVPVRVRWFRYPFPPDGLDDFWWELENSSDFAGARPRPCECHEGPR